MRTDNRKRRICAVLTVFLCVLILCTIFYDRARAQEEEWGTPSNSNYTIKVAENDKYELMANEDGTIAVLDKKSRHLYESNPRGEDAIAVGVNMTNKMSQLYVTYTDTAGNVSTKNSQTECVNKGWLTYKKTDDGGIRFLYDFQGTGFEIPVEYHINDKGLRADIMLCDIVENKGETEIYLTDIALLPFFGAAGMEASGYMFVPDGSGALIYLNNDKASYGAYSQTVYGRDIALVTEKLSVENETARIPVFGMKDGENGFLAVISSGDTNATINAMTSGVLNSYNNAYTSFRYRPFVRSTFLQGNAYAANGRGDTVVSLTISPVLPKTERYSVEYLLMSETDLDYVDMAEAYREYLSERYGMTEKVTGEVPFYLNLLGGLKVEDYILGVKTHALKPLTTFAQAQTILDYFQSAGIDSLAVKYTGWQKGGMESKLPAKISFESKLGGTSGYGRLVEYVSERDIELFLDFDFVNLYESGNGISSYSDAAQTVGSTPAYQYTYDYNSLSKKESERWKIVTPTKLTSALTSMINKKSKLQGMNLALSSLGNSIYSDFSPKKDGLDRADVIELWQDMFEQCSDQFSSIMVDNGNAYTFPYVSHIYDAPLQSSGYDIEDESVPFYQIVLHGFVSYSTEPVNLSSVPETLLLKAVETGSSLSACLMYAGNEALIDTKYNNIFSGNYETWVETLASYYGRAEECLKLVASAKITGHKKVMEDVYRTEFSNGYVVYVNYREKEVTVDGVVIAPKDFTYQEIQNKKQKGGE